MRNPFPLALVAGLASAAVSAQPVTVAPTLETQPLAGVTGDLRDVALWVNPADAGASLIIAAHDNPNAGLVTFGVNGQQLEAELPDGPVQSVAVRDDFPLGGGTRTLVVTASTNFNGLAAYRLDPGGADRLVRIGPAGFFTGTQYSTVALYRSRATNRFYVFAGTQAGRLEQLELTGADGGVTATPARVLLPGGGGGIEGVVVDEEFGRVLVTQEGQGLWRFAAEPDGGTTGVQVAAQGGGQLGTDVGRVALYRAASDEGYVIVTDTTADAFAVFDRRSLVSVGSFRLVADGGIDAVEDPVALAVTSRPAGAAFPDGVFVAHDGTVSPQNLKLASWASVAQAFNPPLRIDTRQVADGGTDGGTGGEQDAGPDVVPLPPPGQEVIPDDGDDSGCACSSASVPATALFGLLGLALLRRRRS
jgi:3-phytase